MDQKRIISSLGIMIDCSRNAVMSVGELKRFMLLMSEMGYNRLMLYTEDTYEVAGEPYFGYFRGRYTAAELTELDNCAFGLGIELVPCIQTLAHLNAIFRWPEYSEIRDISDILLAGDERTYRLIENMFSSLRRCFRTDKIHIGMDEAHMLGKGRYRDIHGERDRTAILLEHLERVCALAEKYGFEPMMWSDMFYRLAAGGEYYSSGTEFDASVRAKIPKGLTLVYWDYYHTDKQFYSAMIEGHKQLTDRVAFAGGAWKWSGFTPHNTFALKATEAALTACVENGIDDVFITLWGDDGGEASPYAMLPTLHLASCLAHGITDENEIDGRFLKLTGMRTEEFMLLDLPDLVGGVNEDDNANPSKLLLYNDCFMGIYDGAVSDGDGAGYADAAARLEAASGRAGEYAYLFAALSALCRVLEYKAEIGVRTRDAYARRDRAALSRIASGYDDMIERTRAFYRAFRVQWHKENKPHGFDVQDIRLGGLIMRMSDCRDRLNDYLSGAVGSIPELEEEPLAPVRRKCCVNHWASTVTANVL